MGYSGRSDYSFLLPKLLEIRIFPNVHLATSTFFLPNISWIRSLGVSLSCSTFFLFCLILVDITQLCTLLFLSANSVVFQIFLCFFICVETKSLGRILPDILVSITSQPLSDSHNSCMTMCGERVPCLSLERFFLPPASHFHRSPRSDSLRFVWSLAFSYQREITQKEGSTTITRAAPINIVWGPAFYELVRSVSSVCLLPRWSEWAREQAKWRECEVRVGERSWEMERVREKD